jgi:SAM-dependent methyltransferase
MLHNPTNTDWNGTQPKLGEWYASFLGQSMLKEVNFHLEEILRPVFGYQGLQLGRLGAEDNLLDKAGLLRRFVLGANDTQPDVDLSANVLELPIASHTISLLVMPHTLEFCCNPHQVLREADRVLARDGYLLILGFNPLSSWGLARGLRLWNRGTPWNGKFYRQARINDWLSLLNFRVVESRKFFLRPPFARPGILARLSFLEKLHPWLNIFGGAYLILVRKQVRPLTPRLQRWRQRQSVVARRIIGPLNKAHSDS